MCQTFIYQYTFNILCEVFVVLLGIIEVSDEFKPLRPLHKSPNFLFIKYPGDT